MLAMRKAAEESGVKVCVCFECRFSSQFLATKAVIDAGLLGTLHYGEIDYYHGIGPWYGQYRWNIKRELGGSALLTAGCHALDALLLCMGGDVEEVTSYATQSANPIFSAYEYPTTSTTILKFRSGAVGKCAAVVDCLQPYYFHTHLVGSEGSLLDNQFPLAEARRPEQSRLEPAVDEDARQRRRRAIIRTRRSSRRSSTRSTPGRTCRSPASRTASPRTGSSPPRIVGGGRKAGQSGGVEAAPKPTKFQIPTHSQLPTPKPNSPKPPN